MSTPAFDAARLRAELAPYPQRGDAASGIAGYRATYGLPDAATAAHRYGLLRIAGQDLFCQRFDPAGEPRGQLLLLHGLFDHGALWRHQVRWALDRGLAALLIDLPGHGLSGGPRAHVERFDDYVDALEAALPVLTEQLPRPLIAMGHSTGCAVFMQAILDANRRGFDPDDLVLLAPLVRPANDAAVRFALPILARLRRALPRRPDGNTSDPAFNALRRDGDPLQPRELSVTWLRAMVRWGRGFDALPLSTRSPLIVQGTADRVVDWRGNLPRIRSRFDDPQIELLDGALHNLMNEAEPVRARIEQLLDARLAVLLGG